MKLTKFMCAAFAAAVALASCQKEQAGTQAPAENGELKSITVNLANVEMVAKSASTAGDLAGTSAVVTNFEVFFTNAAGDKFYKGLNANGTAMSHYFTTGVGLKTFHYLSAEVTRVIVVANLGQLSPAPTNVTELLANTGEIASMQEANIATLAMYGETSTLTPTGEHTAVHPANKVYSASVAIKPLVARLEVNTFGVKFSDATPGQNSAFTSVRIDKLAFDNYYPNAALTGAVSGERVRQEFVNFDDPVQLKNGQTTYFNGVNGSNWWGDVVDASLAVADVQSIILTRDVVNDEVTPSPAQTKTHALAGHYYAYHFFPTAATAYTQDGYPRLYLQVTSTNVQGDQATQYIMTKNFNGNAFTAFEAGKIYRVNYTFPDSLLEDPLICAEVDITVTPWTVVELTPDWN